MTFFSIGSRSSFWSVSGSKMVPKINQNRWKNHPKRSKIDPGGSQINLGGSKIDPGASRRAKKCVSSMSAMVFLAKNGSPGGPNGARNGGKNRQNRYQKSTFFSRGSRSPFWSVLGSKMRWKWAKIHRQGGPKTKTAISRGSCSRVHGSTIIEVRRPRKLSRNLRKTMKKRIAKKVTKKNTFLSIFGWFGVHFRTPKSTVLSIFDHCFSLLFFRLAFLTIFARFLNVVRDFSKARPLKCTVNNNTNEEGASETYVFYESEWDERPNGRRVAKATSRL